MSVYASTARTSLDPQTYSKISGTGPVIPRVLHEAPGLQFRLCDSHRVIRDPEPEAYKCDGRPGSLTMSLPGPPQRTSAYVRFHFSPAFLPLTALAATVCQASTSETTRMSIESKSLFRHGQTREGMTHGSMWSTTFPKTGDSRNGHGQGGRSLCSRIQILGEEGDGISAARTQSWS
jgi:hypothetical protein